MAEIRTTNLRFNLDKEIQNKAWRYLQTMDKRKFKSYSQAVAVAVADYFDRYYRDQSDPYFETRAREERFVEQIVAAVERAMRDTMPVFLAGCLAGLGQAPAQAAPLPPAPTADEDKIDWHFLGE